VAIKVNFTLPEDVLTRLKDNVGDGERSAFVAAALRTKLAQLEAEKLEAELIEGYQATAKEGAAVNAEWNSITMEGWPSDDDE